MSSVDTSVYPSAFDPEKFFLLAANNISTTLTAYVAPNQVTVINVNTTAGFPDEGVLSIDKEVIYYRSKTAGSFRNITRGYDNTIAFQHVAGALVELRWVAAHHNRLKNAVKAVERTLGINPQGLYPDLSSRLNAFFNSINKRTSRVFNKTNGTPTEVGYVNGPRLARMFVCPERFIKVSKYAPVVYLDGLAQIQNDTSLLADNLQVTTIDVNNGTGKGVITCSTGSFNGVVSTGDIVVIKGTATNNDAYIVDSVLSNTQIRLTETIFGVDGSVGAISIVDISDVTYPVKDVFSMPTTFTSTDEADAIIFIDPPTTDQNVRVDYEIKNSGSIVTFTDPIAVLADYQSPTHSGSVSTSGIDLFTLDIGRTRALVVKIHLTANSTPSTGVRIEIFGKNDLSELQYSVDVDLTALFIDDYVWHFVNKDAVPLNNVYVKITNLTAQAFTYTFTLEVEALGNNA